MRFLAAAGLVMILSGLGAYYATERELSLFSIANLLAGPLLLALAGIAEVRRLRGFSGHFSRAVALRWTLISLAVVAVAIGANALASGWGAVIDLTVERSYTLSDQTRRVCASSAASEGPKPELLFFEHTRLWKEVVPLIEAYREACPGLAIRQLGVADAPPAARAVLARGEATVVVCVAGRCERVGFPSEENITNALLRGTRPEARTAYFLLGHGEVNLADDGDDGFSQLAEALQAEGVALRGWIGPARESVPADADLVIIAAPERDLLGPEVEALDAYLRSGGRLLALLAPGNATNFEALLEQWGFGLPAGVVVDAAASPLLEEPLAVSLIVNSFTPLHPITESMGRRTMMLVPTARPVFVTRKPEPDDQLRELAFSSRRSWVERDVESAVADRPIEPDPDELQGREISIAASGRYPRDGREARIVVIGDENFASNRMLGALFNRDLLMNAILWLTEDEETIAIRPKIWTPDHHPLALQDTLAYFYFLAFALPEALLLLGIAAWYRQRS
jgi:ABC-type uncharacterized transport system involved in gliding motility auxiliary subunit